MQLSNSIIEGTNSLDDLHIYGSPAGSVGGFSGRGGRGADLRG